MIPIPIQTSGRTYAATFAVFLFSWPLLILLIAREIGPEHPKTNVIVVVWALIAVMVLSYVLTFIRCSSEITSYWGGLCLISGDWMTGCANISVVIIMPILLITHTLACMLSFLSILYGRAFSQRGFLRLCYFGSMRGFDLGAASGQLDSQGGGLSRRDSR